MCGIFGCICRKGSKGCVGLKKLKPLQVDQIRRRGPDAVSSVDMEVGGCSVSLCGTVLHMRGQLTKQPVVSEGGNALLWNGEVYGGLKLRDDENDTTTVLEALDKCSSDEEVLAILSSIRGPWAMIYMQYSTGRMWFGRDVFGRRSLLWHLPSEVEDFFAVTSVAAKDSLDWEHSVGDADKDQLWKEIPAVGVFYVDLKKLFSEGVVSSLWCCPWIQGEQPYQEDVECSIDHIHTSMKLRVVERSNLFVNFPPLNKTIPSCDRKESHVTGSQETVVIHDEIFPSRSIGTSVDTKLCVKESDKQLYQSVKSHGGKQKQKTCILQPQDGVQEYDPVVKPVNAQQQVVAEKHPESNQQQQQCGMGAKLRSSQQQFGMGTNLGTKHEQPDIKNLGDHSVGSRDTEKDDLKPFHGSALSRGQQTLPSDLAAYFLDLLRQSVLRRVHNLPVVAKAEVKDGCLATGARLGILFSGGVDSVVMAALADLCMPVGEPIDLINVAFDQNAVVKKPGEVKGKRIRKDENDPERKMPYIPNYDVPDRRLAVASLKELNQQRQWNLILVNVQKEEAERAREKHFRHLVYPLQTVLDDSIGCALWFAARGSGVLYTDQEKGVAQRCISSAKGLLVGIGADEQLAGYSRHRNQFVRNGWEGLLSEVDMDVLRISRRNLGRDDRCVADHMREARFPFLDEEVVSFLQNLPIDQKVDLSLPRGTGEKKLLRDVAKMLGCHSGCVAPKQAIQFGSRSAKVTGSHGEQGSDVCGRLQ